MTGSKVDILVVEDEDGIRDGLCDVLAFHGYQPRGEADGEGGLREAMTARYSLILLDVMLPYINGFEICRRVRASHPEQPILMLTAKGSEADIVEGFKAGCDDYVTKPFSLQELLARVEALLRRSGRLVENVSRSFVFAGWRIDPSELLAEKQGRTIHLSRREVDLMGLFDKERGRIVSRRTLLREVWALEHAEKINTRTVDMHIAKLRKKIDGPGRSCIETVRGEGYRFVGSSS